MHDDKHNAKSPIDQDRSWPFGKMLGSATVGKNGQINIPVEAFDMLDVEEGDRLAVFGNRYTATIALVRTDAFEKVAGSIRDTSSKLERLSEDILRAATGSPDPKPEGKVGDASDVSIHPNKEG